MLRMDLRMDALAEAIRDPAPPLCLVILGFSPRIQLSVGALRVTVWRASQPSCSCRQTVEPWALGTSPRVTSEQASATEAPPPAALKLRFTASSSPSSKRSLASPRRGRRSEDGTAPSVFPPSPSERGRAGVGVYRAWGWTQLHGLAASLPEGFKERGSAGAERPPSDFAKPAAFRRPRRCSMQAEGAIHIRKRAVGPTRLL